MYIYPHTYEAINGSESISPKHNVRRDDPVGILQDGVRKAAQWEAGRRLKDTGETGGISGGGFPWKNGDLSKLSPGKIAWKNSK